MDPNKTSNQIPTTPLVSSTSEKAPWSYWSLIIASFIGGLPTGYLVVWQNLKRMGLENDAKIFLRWGGLTLLVIFIVVSLSGSKSGSVSILLGLLPALYFWQRYLKKLPATSPKPKFSWDIFKWIFIGVAIEILYIILYLAVTK